MITLTNPALEKVKEFQSLPDHAGKVFRIAVESGGCSGFEYKFTFDLPTAQDRTWEFGDVRVVVDNASLPLLIGATVDFTEDFQGAGFTVRNPNSTESCGCGKSFGV